MSITSVAELYCWNCNWPLVLDGKLKCPRCKTEVLPTQPEGKQYCPNCKRTLIIDGEIKCPRCKKAKSSVFQMKEEKVERGEEVKRTRIDTISDLLQFSDFVEIETLRWFAKILGLEYVRQSCAESWIEAVDKMPNQTLEERIPSTNPAHMIEMCEKGVGVISFEYVGKGFYQYKGHYHFPEGNKR